MHVKHETEEYKNR